jgi:DeoR/GlpR family transcriptional regulator of sugar metabolism
MSSDNLLLRERHELILQRLQADGRVLAPDLARLLNVSEDTIRRDLRDLAAAGLCQKVYGGALRMPLPSPPDNGSPAQRRNVQVDAKTRLARMAAGRVVAGSVVLIDAGSTNLCIAAALPDLPLTVVTNSPAIAAVLLEKPRIELIMIGGRIDSAIGASVGATALREIGLIRPDLFVLGACGVDAQAGITSVHFEEAEFKRRVAALSKSVLVATTSDKLGTAATYLVLAASKLDVLVVEHDIDAQLATAFSTVGVQLLRTERP